jgi:hypothetical protein
MKNVHDRERFALLIAVRGDDTYRNVLFHAFAIDLAYLILETECRVREYQGNDC